MPLNSMTGFARAAGEVEPFTFQWELKSVNGRGLDVRLRLPSGFEMLERQVRQRISDRLARGSVQVAFSYDLKPQQQGRVRVNRALLDSLVNAAERAARRAEQAVVRIDMAALMQVRGVLEAGNGERAGWAEEYGERLLAVLDEALTALQQARAAEGARIEEVLRAQLAEIAALVQRAREHPGRAPEAIRERLREQVARLLEAADGELDEQRLHQEAVLLAVKADIAEELDRLDAHLQAAHELLAANAPVGRRLEFLAQEFNREANTLCAKAADATLSAIGMELKAVIDRFREQAANIE